MRVLISVCLRTRAVCKSACAAGISECEGQHWTEHRRFVLHTLRDFCFGKLSVQDRVHEAADRLVARLEGAAGKALNPEPLLNEAVVSVLASLLFDVPSSDDQGDLVRLIRLVNGATPFLHATLPNLWTWCVAPNCSHYSRGTGLCFPLISAGDAADDIRAQPVFQCFT